MSVSVFVSVSLCASRMGFWSICPSFHTYICMCANERERERERDLLGTILGVKVGTHVMYGMYVRVYSEEEEVYSKQKRDE